MADYLNIAGRIRTTASDGVAIEAQEVKDLSLNKSQQEVNADVQTELGDRYTKEETYSKEQLDELITTPDVNYVSVVATDATTAVTDILPATGDANTIYRVGNWNGTQYDPTMYALFAWNGTTYVCVAVRSFVGEVYDVSVNHPDGQGNPTPYADLTAALGTDGENIPADIRRGGMRIQFIKGNAQSSDNKYVQCRLMANEFTTDTTQWAIAEEGVYVENPEFIYVKTDAKGKILWAIKTDGGIYYGAGVPKQIVDYIQEKIAELSLDEYGDIVTFLDGLEEGDVNLRTMLNAINSTLGEKVNKVEGKSLIDARYAECASSQENPEFIEAKVDEESKLLEGIKKDGSKYIAGDMEVKGTIKNEYIEQQIDSRVEKESGKSLISSKFASLQDVIYNPYYLEVKTDGENKILEGITKDIRKKINIPVDTPINSIDYLQCQGWIQVLVDGKNKILEGTTINGEKYIGAFDSKTKEYINSFVNINDSVINIPQLDADFISPVPLTVTGTKGNENAKYEFDLPLSNSNWGVRFRFRITENILNANKSAVIASINNTSVGIHTIPLFQDTSTYTYNGETKTCYWPSLRGGVVWNMDYPHQYYKKNIGNFAFSVKYVGNEDDVSIVNDGTGIVLTIGQINYSFPFTTYDTVASLYDAISAVEDIVVDYREIETRMTTELAVFGTVKLVSTYYGNTNGSIDGVKEEYKDAAPFFIRYAIDTNWHSVEILKIEDKIYTIVDGISKKYTIFSNDNILTLGGQCGILFKDFYVDCLKPFDAEEVTTIGDVTFVISSWNPHFVIHEGHGIVKTPSHLTLHSSEMGTTIDRLQLIYSKLKEKGYVAVSIKDIEDFYQGNKNLPKRCFTSVFDDYRFDNFTDLSNREVFTRFGVKPALAVITDREDVITENGQTIDINTATDIGRRIGFEFVSHTRNHRDVTAIKPSHYIYEFNQDTYSADMKGVIPCVLVYPYGNFNRYLFDTMEWEGYTLGINIQPSETLPAINNIGLSQFCIFREEIGLRYDIDKILDKII